MTDTAVDQNNLEELRTYCIDFAKDMLTRYGEFYPFGAVMEPGGEYMTVGGQPEEGSPSNQEVYVLLQDELKREFAEGEIVAAALAADVSIPGQFKAEYPDGIRVLVECKGYARIYYVPYSINRRGPSDKNTRQLRTLICGETITEEVNPTLAGTIENPK